MNALHGPIDLELTEFGKRHLVEVGLWPQISTNNHPQEGITDMDTYYELRFDDETPAQEVRDVTSVEGAKAVAKTVAGVTGKRVNLVKITPIDVNAPARTRATASAD